MKYRRLIAVAATLGAAAALAGTAAGTTPGTNGLIVFSQEVGAHVQLFTIRPDGSGKRQITKSSGVDWLNPDWSPDGKTIVAERDGANQAGIAVMAANGTAVRILTPKGFQGQPSYSPTGKWIAYERDVAPGNNGVWMMRSDGTGRHRVTRNPFRGGDCGCDTDPNFSPDGTLISFVRIKKAEHLQALFVVRPNGTGLRQLTPYTWDVAVKHDWSPDGKLILVTTNADFATPGQAANLVTIHPDGTGTTQLTQLKSGEQNAFAGSFSPDGKDVVFRLEGGNTYTLAVMDLASRAITRLMTGADIPKFIDWGTHA